MSAAAGSAWKCGCSLTCAPLLALARLSIADEAVALQHESKDLVQACLLSMLGDP